MAEPFNPRLDRRPQSTPEKRLIPGDGQTPSSAIDPMDEAMPSTRRWGDSVVPPGADPSPSKLAMSSSNVEPLPTVSILGGCCCTAEFDDDTVLEDAARKEALDR